MERSGLLRRGVDILRLPMDEHRLCQLDAYMEAVLDCNKTYNLMKADGVDELAVNHVLDSLAGAEVLASVLESMRRADSAGAVRVGDIGSGGGCPGIPLSIAFPNVSFTLVERMERRAAFLEQTVRNLGLENVSVLCSRAEDVPADSFDVAVFRAFHPFAKEPGDKKLLRTLRVLLRDGGFLLAYKARSEKIAQEMDLVKDWVCSYTKKALTVPFLEDHERNLVLIRKQDIVL